MKAFISILLSISFTIFSTHLSAQRINKVEYNTYSYNLKTYEFQDMEDIFIADFYSYMEYKSAIQARNKTRRNGHYTLGVMAVSIFAIAIDNNIRPCEFICVSTGDVIGLMGLFFVVPITATIGLVTRINYDSRKKRAIKLFNTSEQIGCINNTEQWNLKIGGGQYGYGIVLNF